jgi:hypothetical protein
MTFEFAKKSKIGAIRSSTAVTILFFLILTVVNFFTEIKVEYFVTVAFGASFVGMSCPSRFSRFAVVVGSIIFGFLFYYLVPLLEGLGGALGFSAFVSICIVSTLYFFKNQILLLTDQESGQ